jgi:hypothetical protein
MCAELQYATAINQRSATMIEFKLADRNGDGLPETVRYEWSGTAGAALTRKYNNGTAVDVLSDVREFGLSCDVQTINTIIPQTNESPETLLIGYTSSTDYGDYAIKSGQWFAEYFHPVLPANAVSWRMTRVEFQAKAAGSKAGETKVQIQRSTGSGTPSGIVLEEKTLYESGLSSSYLQCGMVYVGISGIPPQQGLCLVFKWVSDADACQLLGQNKNVAAANLSLVKSTNQGNAWTTLSGQSLLFSVYGTVTTTGTPQIQNTYHLDGVQIWLQAGADGRSLVQTAVRTVNEPEVFQ